MITKEFFIYLLATRLSSSSSFINFIILKKQILKHPHKLQAVPAYLIIMFMRRKPGPGVQGVCSVTSLGRALPPQL